MNECYFLTNFTCWGPEGNVKSYFWMKPFISLFHFNLSSLLIKLCCNGKSSIFRKNPEWGSRAFPSRSRRLWRQLFITQKKSELLQVQVPAIAPGGFSDALMLGSELSSALSRHSLEHLTVPNTETGGSEAFPRTLYCLICLSASENPGNTFQCMSTSEIFTYFLGEGILLFSPSDSSLVTRP